MLDLWLLLCCIRIATPKSVILAVISTLEEEAASCRASCRLPKSCNCIQEHILICRKFSRCSDLPRRQLNDSDSKNAPTYLQKDVSRIQVSMANSFGMNVCHTRRNILQCAHDAVPVCTNRIRVKQAMANRICQAASVAKFLQEKLT